MPDYLALLLHPILPLLTPQTHNFNIPSLRQHLGRALSGILTAWQEELRPILLRRMKEDVEDLPEKEEVVVRVQLTKQQRRFYNGIYEKQARLSVGCSGMADQSML